MTLTRKSTALGAGLLAFGLAVSACSSSKSTAGGSNSTSAGKAGGTLQVLINSDFEHLDPQRNYVVPALDFGRLLYRTLTTYKSVPGTNGLEIAPDLATDLGEPSDGGKTWTFHLKSGLKYEDGTPITSQDVKYGVERSFSDLLPEGPQYAKQWLIGGDKYPGPYKDGGKGLDSIVTPNASTIIFKLTEPHGDFNYATALPTFSPVPKAKDTGINYDKHVFSSGPYKIQTYNLGKNMVLVRNPYWSSKTDSVRKALPDQIDVTIGVDVDVIDQRLLAANGTDANAIQLDTSVEPANVAKALQPQYSARRISGFTGFLRYFAINTTHKPLDNVNVRAALNLCTNKLAQQTARGGSNAAGDITQQILVPSVKGYVHYDPLGLDSKPQGDPAAAKAKLQAAGVKLPLTLTLQANDTGKGVKQATALQAAFKLCDINLKINQLPTATYYTTVGKPAQEADLVTAAWGPDWPVASTVIPPLFDSRQIKPAGNQVFSLFKGAEATQLDNEMDTATAETDAAKQTADWTALDHKITDLNLFIPLLADKAIYLAGPNVSNFFLQAYYGEPDLVALGVNK